MKTWQAVTRTAHPPAELLPEFSGAHAATGMASISPVRQEPPLTVFLRELSRNARLSWKWLEQKRTQQLAGRRIRVSETVSLGEKRFVSIVQVDGAHFLIGSAAGSISLLARLDQQAQEEGAACRECATSMAKDR